MSKRFGEAMRLMRRRNGQDCETGFAMLKPHAAEHLDELIEEFHREEDDQGLRAWLLELIGEAGDPRALPLFVAHLDDERFGDWAIWGLEKLGTKEARTALYRHRSNKHTWGRSVDHAYRLEMTPPAVDDYLRLRKESGLSARTVEEAENGINGAWASAHVVHVESGETVGMGRVLSDGGWYFHIIDMAVLPHHQRKGIGDAIMTALLDRIGEHAPNAYVNLLADPPGRRLYERHGFTESAPASVGMRRV